MKEKSYFIHDNYSMPFKVTINKNEIRVYKYYDCNEKYNILVHTINNYLNVFIGTAAKKKFKGNTILVQIDTNSYIYIGGMIYSFEIDDQIIEYISPIGNNDVPYPYAIGTKYTYLMLEQFYVPNNKLNVEDPYQQYYAHDKVNFKKYEITTIIKRFG